ncbi:STAS domain-containing protein [Streptomyces sp. NPDC015131]|uniref:STAS domain-containing protein n=1 Tax=Streptomyces sp. NPDC015131 TaxID=3364941 RepID=UPI003701612A
MEQAGVRVRVEVRPEGAGGAGTGTGVAVVSVGGELDYDGVGQLEEAIRSVRDEGVHRLVFDLSGLTFMDSSGVNSFLRAQRDAQAGDGWVRLADPQSSVLRVIELVGLAQAIPLHTTVGEALEA